MRQKLFAAIIDDVTVKEIGDLDMREVEKENMEFRAAEDVMTLLSRIYDRVVTPLETVYNHFFFRPSERNPASPR